MDCYFLMQVSFFFFPEENGAVYNSLLSGGKRSINSDENLSRASGKCRPGARICAAYQTSIVHESQMMCKGNLFKGM